LDTILDYVDHWAAVQPDKCFSAFLDSHGKSREIYTYRSFQTRTHFLAEYLRDETSARRGDRVALVYSPGLEMVASFVACARIGAIPVPVPPVTSVAKGGAARLRSVLVDSGARLALADSSFGSGLPGRQEAVGPEDP
jgi:acyl-CoA synthetase (AMP-forming)/AMP-acid ligase II